MKLSVIIPCYNERATIREIVRRVQDAPCLGLEREIVVVDDCSGDGSREILQELAARGSPSLRVLLKDENRGKGAALRDGFARAGGDIFLIQDADLEYDPREYPALLEPIVDGRADVVFGSRFLGGTHRVMYLWHYYGNRALTHLSNLTTGLHLTDVHTCYKVFRRELLPRLRLRSDGFEIDPEFTAKVARLGCRIYEVPISYSSRTRAEGKKIRLRDGLSALRCIARWGLLDRFSSWKEGEEEEGEGGAGDRKD